jgi:glycosyltransferase involved in cell wall biosynthesis
MVFHVESRGAARIGRILNKPIPCIPHPVDVTKIKLFRKQPFEIPTITCQYHRYWGTWSVYYYATRNIPEIQTILCNLGGNLPQRVSFEVYFGEVVGATHHQTYIDKYLSKAYINLDVTPDKTYGRGLVEAAALGLPTISNTTNEAATRIFPEIMINDQDDDVAMHDTLEKLLFNTEFAKDMSDKGLERCEYYNYKNSYKRMLIALEERDLV